MVYSLDLNHYSINKLTPKIIHIHELSKMADARYIDGIQENGKCVFRDLHGKCFNNLKHFNVSRLHNEDGIFS